MRRGEIWTAAAPGLASKPRPALIIQDDRFAGSACVTICLITSDEIYLDQFRIRLEPTAANGLKKPSQIMGDMVMTVPRMKLGIQVGTISPEEMTALERKLLVYLGMTG